MRLPPHTSMLRYAGLCRSAGINRVNICYNLTTSGLPSPGRIHSAEFHGGRRRSVEADLAEKLSDGGAD